MVGRSRDSGAAAAAAAAKMNDAAGSSSSGGRFVAHLSRRVKACDECRRHKIRCNLPATGAPPCSRCVKNGLECQLTKSLQSILDERQGEKAWKASVEARLDAIARYLEEGASREALLELKSVVREQKERGQAGDEDDGGGSTPKRRRLELARSDSPVEGSLGLGLLADAASGDDTLLGKQHWSDEELAEPAYAPGEHLRQLAVETTNEMKAAEEDSNAKGRKKQSDIIDQGIINLRQACTLVDIYMEHLDGNVYSMIARRRHVAEDARHIVPMIRDSPLLLLAICTVASLHCNRQIDTNGKVVMGASSAATAARLYSTLYHEFVRVSAQQSFSRHQTMDDIRALVIASMWMRELSWILTASAVRLVTERGMQDSFKKCTDLKAGKAYLSLGEEQACLPACAVSPHQTPGAEQSKAYEEAVLYYQVYVADHQAAIPFSRPPMTRQHAAVRNARAWLVGCSLAKREDARLIGDVEYWVMGHDIVDDFGVDVHQALTRTQVLEQVPRYEALIERWKNRWQQTDDRTDQAEMMSLFLNAHIFRAPPGVSPLLIEGQTDDRFSISLSNDLEYRESMVYAAMPSLPLETGDEKDSRVKMANRAIASAHLIALDKGQRSTVYGKPIYPQVMLIFACLFLNKVSRTYAEDGKQLNSMMLSASQYHPSHDTSECRRVALCACEKGQVIERIQGVVRMIRDQVVSQCIAEQFCASAAPSLASIVSDLKRQHERQVESTSNSAGTPSTALAIFDTATPSFNLDLQTMDLLSDTRFLSGVSNDASLWFAQDWLAGAGPLEGT